MLEADGQGGSRSRKILALAVAVVLSGITFVAAAGEALARQPQTPPEVYAVAPGVGRVAAAPDAELVATVADTVAAEHVPETPPPAEEETLPAGSDMSAEAIPVDSLSAEPVLAMADQQFSELLPEPEPIPGLELQPDPALLSGSGPGFVPPGDMWSVPEVYPAPDFTVLSNSSSPSDLAPGLKIPAPPVGPALIPEPGTFEKNKLLSPHVQEPPAPPSVDARPSLLQQDVTNNTLPAVPVKLSSSPDERKTPAPNVPKTPAVTPVVSKTPAMIPGVSKAPTTSPTVPGWLQGSRPLPGLGAAASNAAETFHNAAASATASAASLAAEVSEVLAVSESYAVDSAAGTEEPTEDTTPRPLPASVPAGGSSFSLPGGGQVGSGSVLPLLLCILASSLILLRRDGPLSLTSFESTELSSALLVPLERPG